MLAYAANSPKAAGRAGSPKALALILAGHAALIAAVLTAKMEFVGRAAGRSELILIDVPVSAAPAASPTVDPQPDAAGHSGIVHRPDATNRRHGAADPLPARHRAQHR